MSEVSSIPVIIIQCSFDYSYIIYHDNLPDKTAQNNWYFCPLCLESDIIRDNFVTTVPTSVIAGMLDPNILLDWNMFLLFSLSKTTFGILRNSMILSRSLRLLPLCSVEPNSAPDIVSLLRLSE